MTNYARITIGTMDEMRKALPLMIPLLAGPLRTLSPGSSGQGDSGLVARGLRLLMTLRSVRRQPDPGRSA